MSSNYTAISTRQKEVRAFHYSNWSSLTKYWVVASKMLTRKPLIMFHTINTSTTIIRTLWLTCFLMFCLSCRLVILDHTILLQWELLNVNSSPINLIIILDPIGTLFSSTVLLISANVYSFSNSYISDENFKKRFALLVLSFILSINFLIFIPHLIGLLLGWDGLGITSFILVIYYQSPKSLAAGIITALTNRIGDVMILLTIAWSLNQGHWSILNIWSTEITSIITLTLILAAMTKRAQIPFSRWLPAAIAAPTPVSALVHSSTLVTAGVFLIIRFYPFLRQTSWFNNTILIIATLTMLIAGIRAIFETDLKKIIALSTLSQLGVIIRSLGLNLPELAFFHLITHALFKALLFICAGNIIQTHHHSQDLRIVGNLPNQIPVTTTSLLTANIALSGLPFIAGFYSKDIIIEHAIFNPTNTLILTILAAATMLTASYSSRLILTAIWSPSLRLPCQYIHNEDEIITNPIITLTRGAIIGGAIINWFIIPSQIEPLLPTPLKLAATIATLIGIIITIRLTTKRTTLKSDLLTSQKTHHSQALMWFLNPISSQGALKPSITLTHQSLKTSDQGWTELLGPQGILSISSITSKENRIWQNNLITTHLSLIATFIIVIVLLISCLDSLYNKA